MVLAKMATLQASKPVETSTKGSTNGTAGGAYKDVTATAYNDDLERKGGDGFQAAKVCSSSMREASVSAVRDKLLIRLSRILCTFQHGTKPILPPH